MSARAGVRPVAPFVADEGFLADARERWARLTARQRDVCRLVALGLTDKEIAARLGISHKTVEYHLQRARLGLGVLRKRLPLAALAAMGALRPFTI